MTNEKYAKLTIGLIVVWFLFSLTASAQHLLITAPGQPPLAVGLAVLVPLVIFAACCFLAVISAVSSIFGSTPLTYLQAWRIAGFVFWSCMPTTSCRVILRCPLAGETSR
jgi:hypothetical protein